MSTTSPPLEVLSSASERLSVAFVVGAAWSFARRRRLSRGAWLWSRFSRQARSTHLRTAVSLARAQRARARTRPPGSCASQNLIVEGSARRRQGDQAPSIGRRHDQGCRQRGEGEVGGREARATEEGRPSARRCSTSVKISSTRARERRALAGGMRSPRLSMGFTSGRVAPARCRSKDGTGAVARSCLSAESSSSREKYPRRRAWGPRTSSKRSSRRRTPSSSTGKSRSPRVPTASAWWRMSVESVSAGGR
jgi:hypothetical protein